MTLINSLDDNFLSDDTYLRDCSKDIIEKSKKMFVRPFTELYSEFNSYNILNIKQINEINLYLNQIVEKLFKKIT